jgi:hypothetical protein
MNECLNLYVAKKTGEAIKILKCLLNLLFAGFSFFKTFRTNTTKRQVLGVASLNVFTARTMKIGAAKSARLHKHHFRT